MILLLLIIVLFSAGARELRAVTSTVPQTHAANSAQTVAPLKPPHAVPSQKKASEKSPASKKKKSKKSSPSIVPVAPPMVTSSATASSIGAKAVPASAVTVDAIDAIIFGRTGVEIVTVSDVARPSLSGAPRSRDDIIFERLVVLDAEQFHVAPDEEALNRYLETIQKENNLTLDQLKGIFADAGYTYEEGREQFKRMQTTNSMLDYRIRSQLVVPRKMVEEYWAQNPIEQEASFEVHYGLVPFKGDDRDEQKKEIEQRLVDGRDPRGISWQDPFWVNESEIDESKLFITTLAAGQASVIPKDSDGFEVYQVMNRKDKKIVSLEERYREITDILRRPKYEELLKNYDKQLRDAVSIVRF